MGATQAQPAPHGGCARWARAMASGSPASQGRAASRPRQKMPILTVDHRVSAGAGGRPMKVSGRKGVQSPKVVGLSGRRVPLARVAPFADLASASEAARMLATLRTHVRTMEAEFHVVREERVATLRERIASGGYRPDLREVARRLLVETFASRAR